jgi:hypothetical protein
MPRRQQTTSPPSEFNQGQDYTPVHKHKKTRNAQPEIPVPQSSNTEGTSSNQVLVTITLNAKPIFQPGDNLSLHGLTLQEEENDDDLDMSQELQCRKQRRWAGSRESRHVGLTTLVVLLVVSFGPWYVFSSSIHTRC